MNIIFQFGEFAAAEESKFWDYFFQFLTVITAVGVPLYIYWRGQVDQIKNERQRKSELEESRLKYLQFLVNDAVLSLGTTFEIMPGIYTEHAKDPLEIPSITEKPPVSIQRIANKITQEDYYHASINRIPGDDISNIFILFDFLDNSLIEFQKHHNKVASDTERLRVEQAGAMNEFVNQCKEVRRNLAKYDLKGRHEDISTKFNSLLNRFWALMDRKDRHDHQRIPNLLLYPIRELFEEFDHVNEIASLRLEAQNLINRQILIVHQNKTHISALHSMISEMHNAYNSESPKLVPLKEYIETLKSVDTRRLDVLPTWRELWLMIINKVK
ncbi:hypothetical protein [Spirosoma pollinicola]|uniref:Uncharacterized protein n=1 Tax=Spirosoma pollinicola TaxID=2057025 RepID=A0A2K8YTL2_9BACT|nr:hypothetical protein [Spirosoma pollinicola]AUD00961.1 hypothetical protein CWM47_03490 [Spirosoma pollinicola]